MVTRIHTSELFNIGETFLNEAEVKEVFVHWEVNVEEQNSQLKINPRINKVVVRMDWIAGEISGLSKDILDDETVFDDVWSLDTEFDTIDDHPIGVVKPTQIWFDEVEVDGKVGTNLKVTFGVY